MHEMTTFADLRRKHGPSQQAFANRCGLTQPQVSQYERALTNATEEVIHRIAEKCDETVETVRTALLGSIAITRDPITKQAAELERLVKDLYMRNDEPGRLNLGAVMGAFGEGCVKLMRTSGSTRFDWPHLAGVARDHRLRIEALPKTAEWATSHGALLAAEGMAGSLASLNLLSEAWPGLVNQIEPVLSHADSDVHIERYVQELGWTMLPAALSNPPSYLKAAEHLADAWADYVFEFAERRQAPPLAQQQIAGVVSLSSGVSDAVLESAAVADRDLVTSTLQAP